MIGEAINREERVPKITPIVMTIAKPNIVDPPKIINAINTKSVVPEVMEVLLRVVFKAWLMI